MNGAREPGCAATLFRWLVGWGLVAVVLYLAVPLIPEEWVLSEDWKVPAGRTVACQLFFVGCDREPPEISGVWLIEAADSVRFRLELVDLGRSEVTGDLLVYLAEGPTFWAVRGRYDFPAVSLELLSQDESCSLRGTMASDGLRIASTVTCRGPDGSSSADVRLDFQRSP